MNSSKSFVTVGGSKLKLICKCFLYKDISRKLVSLKKNWFGLFEKNSL